MTYGVSNFVDRKQACNEPSMYLIQCRNDNNILGLSWLHGANPIIDYSLLITLSRRNWEKETFLWNV